MYVHPSSNTGCYRVVIAQWSECQQLRSEALVRSPVVIYPGIVSLSLFYVDLLLPLVVNQYSYMYKVLMIIFER